MTTAALAAAAVTYVPLSSLWLPILIAALLVWIASALFWTVGPHHKHEFAPLPDEDRVLAALRAGIREVCLPTENERDLTELPVGQRRHLRVHLLRDASDALQLALRPAAGAAENA